MEYRQIWIDWLCIILLCSTFPLLFLHAELYSNFMHYMPLVTVGINILFGINHVNISEEVKNKELYYIIASCLIGCINLKISNSGIGSIVVLCNLFLILFLSDKIILTKQMYYCISFTALIILCMWVGRGDRGYNTNVASRIIFFLIAISIPGLLIFFEQYFKLGKKVLFLIIILMLTVASMVVGLKARGTLLGIAISIFIPFIPSYFWKKKYLNIMCMVLFMMAIVFPIGYVVLWKSGIQITIQTMGKSFFSGRNIVWDQFFYAFLKEPWTGIGSDLQKKIPELKFDEAHNCFLNLLVVYGIIVFALFIGLLWKKTSDIAVKAGESIYGRCIFALFVGLCIISYFENYIFISPYCMAIIILFSSIKSIK